MSDTAANGNAPSPAGKAAWICLAIAWICFLIPIPGIGLFLGWPLNLVAFILAIVAMSKGGAKKGLFQLLASLIGSPIIYFIGVGILAAVVSGPGAYQDYKKRAEAAQHGVAQQAEQSSSIDAEAIAVTAEQLYKDYDANEISADAKYKGKPLLITGTVQSIESDITDDPVVALSADLFGFVHLQGIDKASATSLSKGQKITAACTGGGEVMSFPTANECTIK